MTPEQQIEILIDEIDELKQQIENVKIEQVNNYVKIYGEQVNEVPTAEKCPQCKSDEDIRIKPKNYDCMECGSTWSKSDAEIIQEHTNLHLDNFADEINNYLVNGIVYELLTEYKLKNKLR